MKPTKKLRLFLCLLFFFSFLFKNGSGLNINKDKDNFIGISSPEESNNDSEGQKSKGQYLDSNFIINDEDDNKVNEEDGEQDQDQRIDNNEEIVFGNQILTEIQQVSIDQTQKKQNEISQSFYNSNGEEKVEEEQEIENKKPTTEAAPSKTQQLLVNQKITKLMDIMHFQAQSFKQQSQQYYSKLTNHLGGLINIFMGITGIILAFFILFITVKGFSNDLPFLHGLSSLTNSKKRSNYGFTSPYNEAFYTENNLLNSNTKISGNSYHQTRYSKNDQIQGDQDQNGRDKRQQKDDQLKDPVSSQNLLNKNSHQNRQVFSKKRQQNIDDTFYAIESDFDIQDLLDFQEHQSFENSNQDLDLEEQSTFKIQK